MTIRAGPQTGQALSGEKLLAVIGDASDHTANRADGERQLAVSGYALGHTAIRQAFAVFTI